MLNWSVAIRKGLAVGVRDAEGQAIIQGVLTTKSLIAGIDKVLSTLPLKLKNFEITLNDVPWRKLSPELRLGNIQSFLEAAKIPKTLVVAADEQALKNLLKPIHPEFDVQHIDSLVNSIKSIHPDLNITLTSMEDVAKLSPATKSKIVKLYNDIKTFAKTGLVIAGLFAVIVFGPDLYKSLIDAINNRNGCWLVTKGDKTSTSCKITQRSCAHPKSTKPPCENVKSLTQNTYFLVARAKADASFADELQQYFTKKDAITIDLTQSIESICQKYEQTLYAFLRESPPDPAGYDVCKSFADATCVMCDPNAQANSKEFVYTADLPPRMAYVCIQNSTLLDVLVDVTTDIKDDIWGGVEVIGGLLKKILIYVVAIAAILGVIYFCVKAVWNKRTTEYQFESLSEDPVLE